jgi:hypothetical protein
LLYWYNSTNTDAETTKVTPKPDPRNKLASVKKNTARPKWGASEQQFVFEIENAEAAVLLTRCSLYLLYWYKITNADAEGAASVWETANYTGDKLLSLLYWYKSTNTDA